MTRWFIYLCSLAASGLAASAALLAYVQFALGLAESLGVGMLMVLVSIGLSELHYFGWDKVKERE
jgi:hypothetical protein